MCMSVCERETETEVVCVFMIPCTPQPFSSFGKITCFGKSPLSALVFAVPVELKPYSLRVRVQWAEGFMALYWSITLFYSLGLGWWIWDSS